jgi:hypothetical protein
MRSLEATTTGRGEAAVLQWLRRWWERDRHLARQRSLDPADPLEELIRVVNEAQDRDAETNVGL